MNEHLNPMALRLSGHAQAQESVNEEEATFVICEIIETSSKVPSCPSIPLKKERDGGRERDR